MDILVIESQTDKLKRLTDIASKIGTVSYCINFDKSVAKIHDVFNGGKSVDVFIIDLSIKDSGAIQLLKIIRDNEGSFATPCKVIVVSSDKNSGEILNMFSLEEDLFIQIDIDEQRFIEILSR